MIRIKTYLILFASLSLQFVSAQNIKDEPVEYRYIKLPLTPLPSTVKNYQSFIIAPFEVENQKKRDKYEDDKRKAQADFEQEKAERPMKLKAAEEAYKIEMDAYPAALKAVEDQYNREMEEYNKKSLGKKLLEKEVLNENNKPVKRHVPHPNIHSVQEPYLRYTPEPVLENSYDYAALAGTYLGLEGYERKSENAVKIEVTINGFEYTPARQVVEQKKTSVVQNGATVQQTVNYYYNEFTYRHTMSVKATGPDGVELFNLTPSELNTYKVFKTTSSTTSVPLNEQYLKKTYEEKVLQENLTFISDLVHDKIGFRRELRKGVLYFVKSRDDAYMDLTTAYNDGTTALKTFVDDPEAARTKLDNAMSIWNTALQESNINDKKARIDKNVTQAIYFNLLEAYFVTRDAVNGEKLLTSLNTMQLSKSDVKIKDEYTTLYMDLKKRLMANKM